MLDHFFRQRRQNDANARSHQTERTLNWFTNMNHCTACIFDALWWIGLQNIVKYERQLWLETLNSTKDIQTVDRAQLGLLYSCSLGWRGHSLRNKNWTSTSRQSGCIRSKLDGMPEQWATHQMVGSATRFRGVSRRPQNQSRSVNLGTLLSINI